MSTLSFGMPNRAKSHGDTLRKEDFLLDVTERAGNLADGVMDMGARSHILDAVSYLHMAGNELMRGGHDCGGLPARRAANELDCAASTLADEGSAHAAEASEIANEIRERFGIKRGARLPP